MATTMQSSSVPQSVLIIGATGRMGLECIQQFATIVPHERAPALHAFCRDKKKFESKDELDLLRSVIEGDAKDPNDLKRALKKSRADFVVVSVGNGDSVQAGQTIRTENAKALVQVLQSQPEFEHVRVVVVSSTGAGPSKIKVGLGIGKMIEHHLRHVLKDHSGQEDAFMAIQDRTTVVRPTSLTSGSPTGTALIEFGDEVKSPTIKTDRADLAAWIVKEALVGEHKGKAVNVTGVKKNKQ